MNTQVLKLTLILIAASVTACNGSKVNVFLEQVPKQYHLEKTSCWFDPPQVRPVTECFHMIVPQDYANTDGVWIKFSVVKIVSPHGGGNKSPVLHLGGGGPGNPLGFWPDWDVSWVWNQYQEMSVDSGRDLYLVDPRGVGYATPSLACYEYVDATEQILAQPVAIEQEIRLTSQAYDQCRERYEQLGVDFSQYHSANVARDMEQLRRTLEIEAWSLYGVSYGTRYAQTIAREFPHSVESMVLDAATFVDINYTERSGEAYIQTLDRLISHCRNDAQCGNAVGDVHEQFWGLVARLQVNPLTFEINHPNKHGRLTFVLTGIRFLNIYYNALYDSQYYAHLPAILNSLNRGELGVFENAAWSWIQYLLDTGYADGVAIAHYCHEEAPFVDADKAMQNLEVLPELVRETAVLELSSTLDQCHHWGVEAASNIEFEPIHTDIPTLFLHGELDPVLPVEDLEKQMVTFSRSAKVTFEEIAHTVVGVHPCGAKLARAFYEYKLEFLDHTGVC